jgi:hypothetical protein
VSYLSAIAIAVSLGVSTTVQAQRDPAPPNSPGALRAPARVGRFTLRSTSDLHSVEQGVAYQYASPESTEVTVNLYGGDNGASRTARGDALNREAAKLKEKLSAEQARGAIDEFGIAFEGADTAWVDRTMVPGYKLCYVFRRGETVAVSFLFLYDASSSFVRVRGTVPHANWRASGIPEFAREFVARATSPGPSQ